MNQQPRRVQLKRVKGWRMPDNTVKVDRTTKWGNPFVPGKENPFIPERMVENRRHAFVLYRSMAPLNNKLIATARTELVGKNLACWCPIPHEPYKEDECHAAVLLRLANGDRDT